MSDDMVGRQLGSYRIQELVQRGSMVEVYRGIHVEVERNFILKVIGRHLAPDPLLNERFRREALAAARLHHPNILQVYDFGEEGGGHYVVMEDVESITLAQFTKEMEEGQRYVDRDDITFITRQIADALDYAHAQGIIHFDVNPNTILIKPNGQALLSDFSLATLRARETGKSDGGTPALGTPEYMAPELAISTGRVTPKSDIYSLGVVLYEVTTGTLPFTAETPVDLALKHLNDTPPAPRQVNASLPLAVSRVILLAMAKEPDERFESAMGLATTLEHAWHLDDADDVEPLASGRLRRAGENNPLPSRTPIPPPEPADASSLTETMPAQRTEAFPGRTAPPPSTRRISPLIIVTLAVALLIAAAIFLGRAVGLDGGGIVRGLLGRPQPSIEEGLVVATATPDAASAASPTSSLEEAGVTATPVATVVPEEAPIATPTPLDLPPLEIGTEALRLADTMVMVYVPEGPFLMGTNDLSRPERERPEHEVTLSGYWIDRFEVTNVQYRACVEAGACPPPVNTRNYDDSRYTNFPVAFISWDAASAYCTYVGGTMNLDVRLPTEAQWEKASSWDPVTLVKRTYPWGEDFPTPDKLRYIESITVLQGAEVGTHAAGASAYGVHDLAGNMAEFVFDWSSETYYSLPEAAFDPQGPPEGTGRIIRGGSWAQPGTAAITSRRTVVGTDTNGEEIGFRCAVNATTITAENNIAFTSRQALGAAQAAVALALGSGAGSQPTLTDWQAALITLDAQLDSADVSLVVQEIDSRLGSLDVQVQSGSMPEITALKLRNALQWVRDQLVAEEPIEAPGLTPQPAVTPGEVDAVGG